MLRRGAGRGCLRPETAVRRSAPSPQIARARGPRSAVGHSAVTGLQQRCSSIALRGRPRGHRRGVARVVSIRVRRAAARRAARAPASGLGAGDATGGDQDRAAGVRLGCVRVVQTRLFLNNNNSDPNTLTR